MTGFACACGATIPEVPHWPVRCACGRAQHRPGSEPTPAPNAGQIEPPRRSAEGVAAAIATCNACPRSIDGTHCDVLIQRGRPGLLMHRRGIPRASSRCPIGRWGPEPATHALPVL